MTVSWQKHRSTPVSRRQGLRQVLIAVAAGTGWAGAAIPTAAKRRKRKRKPKRPKPPLLSLEECRATCGETCDCLAAPTGAILCGAVADVSCEAPCQTGSECVAGTCIAVFIPAGDTAVQRFDCDYRAGLCADVVSCFG